MNPTDDFLNQIIEEQKKAKLDFDPSNYNIDDLLNEDMDDKLNLITDNSININETQPEKEKNTSESAIEKENKRKSVNIIEKEEFIILPKYDNPIDLVNYIEVERAKQKIETSKSCFIFESYKKESNIKLNFINILPKKALSNLIHKNKDNVLNLIYAKDDSLITGNVEGDINIYSMKDSKLMKSLNEKKVQLQVNCFDMTPDGNFLLVGYKNGFIAFWDLTKDKCKCVADNIHKSSCIAVQFFKFEEKLYYFFSSDSEGNVFKNVIKDGVFMWRIKDSDLLFSQKNNPTFLIKYITYSDDDKKLNPALETASKGVIFASLTNVQVYTVDPNVEKLLEFSKPSFMKDTNYLPDVTVGLGKPPLSLNIKSDNIIPQLLLTIAWGRVIFLHLLPVVNCQLIEPTLLGHYVSAKPLIRIGFMAESLVYFFDENKVMKVIDTRRVVMGDLSVEKTLNEPIAQANNAICQIDDGRVIAQDIQTQYLLGDFSKKAKETYIHYIIENKKIIHILSKTTLYNISLLNWETCMNSLKKTTEEEWMNLLTKGIEIFQAITPGLAGIPQDEAARKSLVGAYLKEKISEYVKFNINNKETNEQIANCITNTIEFCIEIESFGYLFTNIEQLFDSKDYSDLFLSQLEPFILCDKIVGLNIKEDVVLNIMNLYLKKGRIDLLSQLLIHINIKSIDTNTIKLKCEELSMILPLIYIYMNGKEENYFEPISIMFDKYLHSVSLSNFEGYYKEYEKSKSLSEIRRSKQYIGHKLLWYVKWCLRGKKFPNDTKQMNKDKYKNVIARITYWIIEPNVFNEFIKFDEMNYFDILNKLFGNPKLFKIISEAKTYENIDTTKVISTFENKITDLEPISLLTYLLKECEASNNEKIKLLSKELVIKASSNSDIPKDILISSIEFIFSKYVVKRSITNLTPLPDDCLLKKSEEELSTLSDEFVHLLSTNANFTNEDFQLLLPKSKNTPFDIVTLFLSKQVKEYQSCLELLLDPFSRIPNREKTLFSWIEMTLMHLKETDKKEFTKIKEDIGNNICKIGKLNVNEMFNLVNNWFSNEKKSIILKLDDAPEIQLHFIEIIIKQINLELAENENNIQEDEPGEIATLLKTHIKLLCELNQTEKILPNIKKNPLYPMDECLKLCIEHGVSDAAIYLYQSTGDRGKALDIAMKIFEDSFNKIVSNVSSKFFNENIHTLLLQELHEHLNGCIVICERNEQQTDDLWFRLLDNLYLLLTSVTEKKKKEENEGNKEKKTHFEELETMLSMNIKDLLEKMTSYVSIKKIIEKVTEKKNNAEYREFRELLDKMLNSYSNLTKILDSAKQLLHNSVIINENELIRISQKGNDFILKQCDICHKDFHLTSRKENILIFRCGHLMHERCAVNENRTEEEDSEMLECKICRKNEIDSSIVTVSRSTSKSSNEITSSDSNFIVDDNEVKTEEKIEIFKKWKDFDKRHVQTQKMLIENTINIITKSKSKDNSKDSINTSV